MEKRRIIYITAQSVISDLQDTAGRRKALDRLHVGQFDHVVLESYRGGLSVDELILRVTRDFFQGEGLETSGGLMPVHGPDFGKASEGVELRAPFFCYSAEETVDALETEILKLAGLFERIVIDDAFLTACRCTRCREARGDRDWPEFRRDLLCNVARRWTKAAHEVNHEVELTVKFPQYYDRYHRFGYDAERFPEIFDAVWVGTETRNPETPAFGYVEPYQGYVNAEWMSAHAGDKFQCAWFDSLDCDEQLFYEQALTTTLAAPPATAVFCYGDTLFSGSKIQRLVDAAPLLEHLREVAVAPKGVYTIKPPNSDGGGDLFIFDYLGMLGVPCKPATRLDIDMPCAFVPAHAVENEENRERIKQLVEHGNTVIASFNALARMVGYPEMLELFGYDGAGVMALSAKAAGFEIGKERFPLESPVRLPGDLAPFDAQVLVHARLDAPVGGPLRIPAATLRKHPSGGRAIVWNMGTFGHDAFEITAPLNVPVKTDLFRWPKGVLDILRNTATEPLGFRIDTLPGVACFVFERRFVLLNYSSGAREVSVDGIVLKPATLVSDSANTRCTQTEFFLAPRSIASVEPASAAG